MMDLLTFQFAGVDLFLTVIILAFVCELIDSSLGMGYGTALTPVLLLIGFDKALNIVPCVLLSEFITGIFAGLAHHKVGNVCFKKHSIHLKIALVLGLCSIIGAIIAVLIAINLPNNLLKLYIGMMVLSMGIFILITLKKDFPFSWKKITGLGILASFNKGMSGGGYGPVVTGGQLLSGVKGNNAVAITSLAEGLTSLVGVLFYLLLPTILITSGMVDWVLAPSLIIGAVLSVPLSTSIVKRLNISTLKLSIGVLTTVLGVYTLTKVILDGGFL